MAIAEHRHPGPLRAWMLVRGFLSQNVAMASTYGTMGITMIALQERYAAGRGAISLGFSLVIFGMGLCGPFIARSVDRFGLRRTMTAGAIMAGCGFVMLALSSSIVVFLLAFGLFIGPGVALAGTLPVSLLAGGWYPEARGRAVGLVTMPVMLSLMPMIGVVLIEHFAIEGFYWVLAALYVVLLPVIAGIRRAPGALPTAMHDEAKQDDPLGRVLARPFFWAMVLCGGVMNSVAITAVANIVALLVEQGVGEPTAAVMASLMGVASVVGAFSIGWLGDRIGGGRTLCIAALGYVGSWLLLSSVPAFPLVVAAVFVIGVCGAGTFVAVTVLSAKVFGLERLGHVLGMFGLATLPLTFVLPPLAGWLHDATNGYQAVIAVIVAACTAVSAGFFVLGTFERRAAGA